MKVFFAIVGWLVGLFFLLSAAASYSESRILPALLSLTITLLFLPPIKNWYEKKINITPPIWVKLSLFFGLFVGVLVTFGTSKHSVEPQTAKASDQSKHKVDTKKPESVKKIDEKNNELAVKPSKEKKDNKPLPVKKYQVLSVSDFDYTMGGKQAVYVSFGTDQNHHCSATIHRSSVAEYFSVHSLRNSKAKQLDFSCIMMEKHFLESSKHPSSSGFEIIEIDLAAKTAKIAVTANLVNSSKLGEHFYLEKTILTVSGNHFDNLMMKI